jgi:tetratricopeptide (TPR) repeat protein
VPTKVLDVRRRRGKYVPVLRDSMSVKSGKMQLMQPPGQSPDPRGAVTVSDLVQLLGATRAWAGSPSYRELARRINLRRSRRGGGDAARSSEVVASTVAYCFQRGRRRLDYDLVFDLLRALDVADEQLAWWRRAWQSVFAPPTPAAPVVVSSSLPADVTGFVGRRAELDYLLDTRPTGDSARLGVVRAIEGLAGVGKTHLVIHAGHELLRRGLFDEVQLYVNLRGFDPDQPPVEPVAVLEAFLRTLGVAGNRIPHDLPGRKAAYRSLLQGRRALVVLDNAASTEQVRPLLPRSSTAAVLITSRHTLSDLTDAEHLTLDLFTEAESIAVLSDEVGPLVVDDPDSAGRIARRCANLPLAVGLVARHVRAHPDWPLSDHAARLEQVGLPDAVTAALGMSYAGLAPEVQLMFRLTGMHPGADLTAEDAAALADSDPVTARQHLERLCMEHLLRQRTAGRYESHDLVRAFALARAADEEPATGRRAALRRLFDRYLQAAAAATDTLYPHERHRRPRVEIPVTLARSLADPASARAWLDVEHANLVSVVLNTAKLGWPSYAGDLSTTLSRHLDVSSRHTDSLAVFGAARDAARSTGDRAGEAAALQYLATAQHRLRHHAEALSSVQGALSLRRDLDDLPGEAMSLSLLGTIYIGLGRLSDAINAYHTTLRRLEDADDPQTRAGTLLNLGAVYEQLGDGAEAARYHEQSVALFRQLKNPYGEALAIGNLGSAYRRTGRYPDGLRKHQEALAIFRRLAIEAEEAAALSFVGSAYEQMGRHAEALEHHRQAIAIARRLGDTYTETYALNGVGDALRDLGDHEGALAAHRDACELARHTDERAEHARGLDGIARGLHATGDHEAARRHWQEALELYAELGVPQADDVKTRLASLDDWP